MAKELTDKAKSFCEEYIKNGYNARQAYKTAYWQEDDQKASVSAYQLLKDPRTHEYIDTVEWSFRVAGYKAGISKDTIIKVLQEMMEAKKLDSKWQFVPDWTARHNAIMDFVKLTGDLTEKKNIQVGNVDEEKEELKELTFTELLEKKNKILASL